MNLKRPEHHCLYGLNSAWVWVGQVTWSQRKH
jgi:hypothetical protein